MIALKNRAFLKHDLEDSPNKSKELAMEIMTSWQETGDCAAAGLIIVDFAEGLD